MATVRGVYNLIKDRQKKGIKIGVLEQAIVDAVEAEQSKTIKEINVTFIKNKKEDDDGNS